MKTKIVLSALILTAVSLFAQPKLFIENSTFDWGTSPEGTDLITHAFVVANRGKDSLRITNIRSSCGCTVGEYDSVIVPGGTGSVKVKFNKSGRTGSQASNVSIFTNDPENPQVRLTIRGFIQTALDISPRWQNLFSERGNVKGRVSFTTRNRNFAVKKAEYIINNDTERLIPVNVVMTLQNRSNPDQNGNITYDFEFSFARNVERHENGTISFETNVSEKPNVSMNVSVEPSRGAPY